MLTPRGTLSTSKPEELIVNGSLLTDTLGRKIDGYDDGQAGSDYIGTVTGTRISPGGPALARIQRQPDVASVANVFDRLLNRGELDELVTSTRTRKPAEF
jgi:hypothetical protein